MKKLLVKFSSEISLKGLNRKSFENLLIKNIKERIGKEYSVKKEFGRIFIEDYSQKTIDRVTKVFGVLSAAEADVVGKSIEEIGAAVIEKLKNNNEVKTFKIESKRGDKSFPLTSMEISRKVGGMVLNVLKNLSVDVHNPDIIIYIEVRDEVYIYSKEYKGTAGMPYKSAGKGVLLLSGGIDSPVAGYMLAKRGLEVISVYYHSHPYTSERAKEKVVDLAKKLVEYTGSMRLYIVPFTNIQMNIIENCREDELTILMRRFMAKIAEEIALKEGALSIITGESLGQVASQTLESMYVTGSGISMPVFRPLVGMDKVDIMDISRKIGTYDISILPYEDCCTIFVPKHPKTKPRLKDIELSEEKLNKEELILEAVENAEVIDLK